MKHGPFIVVGLLLASASSWCGMVLAPLVQWLDLQPQKDDATATYYPSRRSGLAEQGSEVYRAMGCFHCHTQVIRARGFGRDLENGLGTRRSVAIDFLYDHTVMPGETRLGPDLTNFGVRSRKAGDTNGVLSRQSILVKLFNPRSVNSASIMPSYPELFEVRKIGKMPSPEALALSPGSGVESGLEVVPKPEALALAAYLSSLDCRKSVFEAPVPKPVKKEIETGTNAPPGGVVGTNVVGTNSAPPK